MASKLARDCSQSAPDVSGQAQTAEAVGDMQRALNRQKYLRGNKDKQAGRKGALESMVQEPVHEKDPKKIQQRGVRRPGLPQQ
ncbi:hypothetical protein N7462_001742 [Penicillium macrosclerotiorum]|uniref:uncharacterized protein n=1 Tax=Penicillium macrosclerotiorum TaxID=303699 RepID=UPI0025473787|nr:uncharacterized protein N7462_001742 [Penicillium macrosclerotiorum]KAJ5692319.1 hypothetical protein N7462_001742 [Penicillium macrosclerotiorum]